MDQDPHGLTLPQADVTNTLKQNTTFTSRTNQTNLPKDFLSFEDAIALIQSDTRQDPKVDIQSLVNNLPYVMPRANCGFTLRLLARTPEGRIVQNGIRYVSLDSEYKCTTFEHTVAQKYEELTRQAITPSIRRASSVVDDTTNPGGYLRQTPDGINVGDDI